MYLDFSLEGGAEHERLPVRPGLLHDGAHLVLEPHVEHTVCLVQNLARRRRQWRRVIGWEGGGAVGPEGAGGLLICCLP